MTYLRRHLSIALLCWGGTLQGQQGLTGEIVAGDSGKGVESAQVVVVRNEAPSQRRFVPVVRETRTTKDGGFSFKDLPAGSYRICVREAGTYLNPCLWPTHAPAAMAVLDGKLDGKVRIVLTPGRRVHVRFNGTEESLLVGIRDTASDVMVKAIDANDATISFPLELSSKSALQADYTAVIPNVPTLRLSIGSTKVALADSEGVELRAIENTFSVPPARKSVGVPGSRVRLDLDPVIVLSVKRRL